MILIGSIAGQDDEITCTSGLELASPLAQLQLCDRSVEVVLDFLAWLSFVTPTVLFINEVRGASTGT